MIKPSDLSGSASPAPSPALVWVIVFATGIVIDRTFAPDPIRVRFIVGLVLMAWIGLTVYRRFRAAACVMLTLWMLLGCLRHGDVALRPQLSIPSELYADSPLLRIEGVIATPPTVRPADVDPLSQAEPPIDRTVAEMEVTGVRLGTGEETRAVSARVWLTVKGHLVTPAVGDSVTVTGRLSRPRGPGNPGEFDFAAWLARKDCDLVLSAGSPDAVETGPLPNRTDWKRTSRRALERVRRHLEYGLTVALPERSAAVATALLIGNRNHLTRDDRNAFIASGMMHLLAISGLHVGILAGFLWLLARLARASDTATVLFVVGTLVAYALLTGGRASVWRATLFLSLLMTGRLLLREVSLPQMLAVTAGLLLLHDPRTLFDPGAQLSFLAVIGLRWGARLGSLWEDRERTRREKLHRLRWRYSSLRFVSEPLRRFRSAVLLMTGVWVWTLPIVAMSFHLLSPIGFFLGVLLIPAVGVLLGFGFLTLLAILISVPLGIVVAIPFGVGLEVLVGITDMAARLSFGHIDLPELPRWWIIGYYGPLLLASSGWRVRETAWEPLRMVSQFRRPIGGIAMTAWLAIGLAWGLVPRADDDTRITVLDVGHGSAILIEPPDGQVWLCDGGSLDSGPRAMEIIRGALRHRGHTRIDAIFVSHVDLDHYNALPKLIRELPVGTVFASQEAIAAESPMWSHLVRACDARGVPLEPLRIGDRIAAGGGVSLLVRHPRTGREYETDNEQSLVCEVTVGTRRVLLTGDLEGRGLSELLRQPGGDCDVLLAPHHGSAAANPERLAEWADPSQVIVSGGREDVLTKLEPMYGAERTLHHTRRDGAVTIVIEPDGELMVRRFRE